MENENLGWDDLKKLVDTETSWRILKKNFFNGGLKETTRNLYFFGAVMGKSPNLINDFKHLLDYKRLKLIIDTYPLTKLYLE